jgi:hypothetical protein
MTDVTSGGRRIKDTGEQYVIVAGSETTATSALSPTDGRKVVTTAGTAVAIAATSTPVTSIAITAETDNTGTIVVGSSTVVAALATRRGIPLAAGDSTILENVDLSEVYLDSTVNGDGVTYTYLV